MRALSAVTLSPRFRMPWTGDFCGVLRFLGVDKALGRYPDLGFVGVLGVAGMYMESDASVP